MRLVRQDPGFRKTKLYDCEIYVREDMQPMQASERYYRFIGSNSFMPISSLVEPEVGEAMLLAPKPLRAPMEFITDITNQKDEVRSVYLRLENCDKVENDGTRLYRIVLYDFREIEERFYTVDNNLFKYRRFLSLSGYYFFEYSTVTEQFVVYKYIDEKGVRLVDEDLDTFVESRMSVSSMTPKSVEQLNRFVQYLKSGKSSFDMEFVDPTNPDLIACAVRGGAMYKDATQIVGLLQPLNIGVREAYYLSPAAKDPATGLLNKRASAEYALEHLSRKDNKLKWIIMMDIDDFKNINDTYGHLFGDLVIQKTAHIMKQVVGRRGIIGRFGGDEFFILLEDVPDREALKILLKTLTKTLFYEFSPKVNLTLSIGVAQYPINATEYETLVGMADKALYIAKEKGKNRHIIYDEEKHGKYETQNQRVKALSYTISKEKRLRAMSDLYSELAITGVSYLKKPGVLNQICEMLDIDAMAVYTKCGDELYCATKTYAEKMPETIPVLKDERYVALFGEDDVFSMTKSAKMDALIPGAYKSIKVRDIASTFQCIGYKGDEPYAWISFDMLENSKKWNDADVERLTILGKMCCRMLCEET